SLYGMATEYDENGNYKYPEGFDPETNEWMEGYEAQREAWETQYALAHERWLAHKAQVAQAMEAETTTGAASEQQPSSYSSAGSAAEGTLASDEALAALREKLTGH
ncbi:MAG: 30S ribosomal protein S1, partial [Actinobacteria bacterium]|nr:30S ribosomal protein S1 [Actinomycetota bacterium]